jgi:hypothetical protein
MVHPLTMDSIENIIRRVIREELALVIGPTARYWGGGRESLGEWYTVRRAASVSGYAPRTISDALRKGELVGAQGSKNGHWRIRAEELDDWVERGGPTGHSPIGLGSK